MASYTASVTPGVDDRITGSSSNYLLDTSDHSITTSNRQTTNAYLTGTASRPRTHASSIGRRPRTGASTTTRPRTGYSTAFENQEIVCAVCESRGVTPTTGLAFVNLDTGEAVLSQINDSQTYVRTIHKVAVFNPNNLLIVSSAASPKSKLYSIIEETLEDIGGSITLIDRKYFAETTGLEDLRRLAFSDDVDSIRTAVSGNYYAVCCFAAALKYIELGMMKTFNAHSLRIKYEPSEGSMMIDLSTIRSLELVENLHNSKSKACLFGLLNSTLTPMGQRFLRSDVLQPLTDTDILSERHDAVDELSTKEELFFGVRQALKGFLDADRILTPLIVVPTKPYLRATEQAINNVIMLKALICSTSPVSEALSGARATKLVEIRQLCAPQQLEPVHALINATINQDTTYAKAPLDLRNQRTYAVRSGRNGLLDVARLTYKEAMADALQHIQDLGAEHRLVLQTKYESTRQFFVRLQASELSTRNLPSVFINVIRRKDKVECTTLTLMKINQRIADSHAEVVMMSDNAVQNLILDLREHMAVLFRVSEGVALLDMLSSFATIVTTAEYTRPNFGDTLAVHAGRHPIQEKIHTTKYIPNDVYASQQNRFQIITGCNMSGKSTYIRSIALMVVMAQIGSFVPAGYASFPIMHQLFARVSLDDNIEANVSTFAAEMRETAFILRNVDRHSLVIIDELGRGTSTRDGLAIALAIAEALVESRALVWFATHFRDLAAIMAERNGVVNLHLAVRNESSDKIEMLYRLNKGAVREEHYGIKLAKVVPLPADVIEHAERVSSTLEKLGKKRSETSQAIVQARRRKLLLNLKEHLIQARNGRMGDDELKRWLKDLQDEFVLAMTSLDEEDARRVVDGGDDMTEDDGATLLSEEVTRTEDTTYMVEDEPSTDH